MKPTTVGFINSVVGVFALCSAGFSNLILVTLVATIALSSVSPHDHIQTEDSNNMTSSFTPKGEELQSVCAVGAGSD